jgi:hypothetical protein
MIDAISLRSSAHFRAHILQRCNQCSPNCRSDSRIPGASDWSSPLSPSVTATSRCASRTGEARKPRWRSRRWCRLRCQRWRKRDFHFYLAGDRDHQGVGDKTFRALERPRIEAGSFRLNDPQRHRFSAFSASRRTGPFHEHGPSPCQVFARRLFVAYRASPTNRIGLRRSDVRKVTNVWKATDVFCATITRFFENETCAIFFGTESPARGLA